MTENEARKLKVGDRVYRRFSPWRVDAGTVVKICNGVDSNGVIISDTRIQIAYDNTAMPDSVRVPYDMIDIIRED